MILISSTNVRSLINSSRFVSGRGDTDDLSFFTMENIGWRLLLRYGKKKKKEKHRWRAMRSRNEFSAVKSNRVIFLIVTNWYVFRTSEYRKNWVNRRIFCWIVRDSRRVLVISFFKLMKLRRSFLFSFLPIEIIRLLIFLSLNVKKDLYGKITDICFWDFQTDDWIARIVSSRWIARRGNVKKIWTHVATRIV